MVTPSRHIRCDRVTSCPNARAARCDLCLSARGAADSASATRTGSIVSINVFPARNSCQPGAALHGRG